MKASAPPLKKDVLMFFTSLWAVSMINLNALRGLTLFLFSPSRMRATTSCPVMPGISISMKTASNGSLLRSWYSNCSTASSPPRATAHWACSDSFAATRSANRWSSSTMRKRFLVTRSTLPGILAED
jgi:hypothetical protein